MEVYVAGFLIALFVAYKVYSETQKKIRVGLRSSEKPKASDYASTFFSLLFSFAKTVAKGGLDGLNKSANKSVNKSINKSYLEKRREGVKSRFGTIDVVGGLLPKRGSIGTIEFYYDGCFPRSTRSEGTLRFYETNGNLQVFFRNADDEKNIKFIGATIDIYRVY